MEVTDAADQPAPAEPRVDEPTSDRSIFPSIIIQGQALARIEAEMRADTTAEFGGVLVGNAAPSTNFVLVTGSLPATPPVRPSAPLPPPEPMDPDALEIIDEATTDEATTDEATAEPPTSAQPEPGAPVNFTFTAAALEELAREVAATYPGQRIVGWYHSHPGVGIFLSAHDLYLQSAFFSQSWQVGYVFDPLQAQGGFFGWSGREVVRVPHWEVTSIANAPGAHLAVNVPAQAAFAAAGRGDSGRGVGLGSDAVLPATPRKRPVGVIIAAVLVAVAIVVGAIAILSGNDDNASSNTDNSTNASTGETVAASTPVVTETTADPASSSTVESEPTTTTEPTTGSSVGDEATSPPSITFPATPSSVQEPASRVGASAVACESSAPGTYEPLEDCFVPLNNGNVMVFVSGSLRCTEPSGQVLAAEAQKFSIGIPADPLVLVADDVLSPTCIDLAYAKNVLADGSGTLDGLCGSSGTQINDGTRRCFGHNSSSGAIAAVTRNPVEQTELVVTCFASSGEPTGVPITWSTTGVDTTWRVDSVVFDSQTERFEATASKDAGTSTATFGCG